jgi:hypothetical protein
MMKLASKKKKVKVGNIKMTGIGSSGGSSG